MHELKYLIGLILIIVFNSNDSYSQGIDFIARGNISIGSQFFSTDYSGSEILISPGGGIGLELGIQVPLIKNLIIQPTIGHQLSMALQFESYNGVSNKSSLTFNRTFISMDIIKLFEVDKPIFRGVIIGTGVQQNFVNNFKRIENNENLGTIKYNQNLGIYGEMGIRLKVANLIYVDPSVRFRKASFKANNYTQGDVSDLPKDERDPSGSGVELAVTFVRIM